jgi:hypothetical protein
VINIVKKSNKTPDEDEDKNQTNECWAFKRKMFKHWLKHKHGCKRHGLRYFWWWRNQYKHENYQREAPCSKHWRKWKAIHSKTSCMKCWKHGKDFSGNVSCFKFCKYWRSLHRGNH